MAKKLNTSKNEITTNLKHTAKPPKKLFYVILILIPFLFFFIIETALRVFDYGYSYDQWVEATDGRLILNPDIAHKYFHITESVPSSNQEVFDAVKKDNSFRIFVLGGSSAAGYPFTPNGSFSRYIHDRLSLAYPESKIEVINCSMTAINSYALRDMIPGIIEQKPDLILIYAGHNEYYGALGIGSMESLGTSRSIVNLVISLEKYRTFQLIRNILNNTFKFFSKENNAPSGTLMARMAQNQFIGLDSDIYQKGILQFKGNMKDILELTKEAKVPVILGTLTCNLKDQYPFVSVSSKKYPTAEKIFKKAKTELKQDNIKKADSLFRFAKDLDALRFRAPSAINKIIKELGKEYNYDVLDIDSAFESISPDHIVGNNLMIDHLHPTLSGYQYMGKVFFDEMKKLNLLPKTPPINLSDEIQDSITIKNFNFSRLDSVIADYRIKLLKNDWPFKNKNSKLPSSSVIDPKNDIDSIAVKLLDNKIIWEEAHRKAAAIYLKRKNIPLFLKEMDVLIAQYPVITEYYNYAVNALLPLKNYDMAVKYLREGYEIKPTAFITKWLGTINLYKNKLDSAKYFLKKSLYFDNKDPQVWYNLAGVYVNEKNYKKALELVKEATSLKSNYTEAAALQKQLEAVVK